jgi:hypothetical protein
MIVEVYIKSKKSLSYGKFRSTQTTISRMSWSDIP